MNTRATLVLYLRSEDESTHVNSPPECIPAVRVDKHLFSTDMRILLKKLQK